MKIRNGFVSNSSSSSFVIAVDGDMEKIFEEISIDIKNATEFTMKEFLMGVAVQIMNVFSDEAEKFTLDEYLEDICYDESEFEKQNPEIYDKIKNHGWKLYTGSIASDDWENPASAMLCEMDIDYIGDKIIIQKDGGY